MPRSSASPAQPGGMRHVVSGNSTIAGPSIVVPGSRPSPVRTSASTSSPSQRIVRRLRSASPVAFSVTSAPGATAAARTVTSSTGAVAVGVAVAALVLGVEGVLELAGVLERDQQLERLARVAQVGRAADLLGVSGELRHELVETGGLGQRLEQAARDVAAALGGGQADGAQHAAGRQAQHARGAELGRPARRRAAGRRRRRRAARRRPDRGRARRRPRAAPAPSR